MSKSSVYEIKVQFGDCDPAGIVFFPNFSKWMDAASCISSWTAACRPGAS
jgi:4-hydroxybenzoyl-CoA thioesterase